MFQNIPPITKNIIIINIVVYLITNLFNSQYLYEILSGYYPFSPLFHSWQVITHMFMHAPWGGGGLGITHILFNMLTLWSFGPALEQTLGEKRYLILYFVSGIGAYFLFNLWNFIEVQQTLSQLESMGTDVKAFFSRFEYFTFRKCRTNKYSERIINKCSVYNVFTNGWSIRGCFWCGGRFCYFIS